MNQDELLQLGDLNLAESHREISRWNPYTDMLLDKCKELQLYQISNSPGLFIEGMLEDKPLPDGVTLQRVINGTMVNDFAEG